MDEEIYEHSEAKPLVQTLAQSKAQAVFERHFSKLREDLQCPFSAFLGCDSVFELDGKIFGKPIDKTEAIKRWIQMSSNSGFLITGHALLFKTPKIKKLDKTCYWVQCLQEWLLQMLHVLLFML